MDFFRFVYPSHLIVPIPFGSRLRLRLVRPAGSGPGGIALRRDPETSLGAREPIRPLFSVITGFAMNYFNGLFQVRLPLSPDRCARGEGAYSAAFQRDCRVCERLFCVLCTLDVGKEELNAGYGSASGLA